MDQLVFFRWWVDAQKRVQTWPVRKRVVLLSVCIVAGTIARLWAQSLPGNWDFNQWVNISQAALNGIDPYSEYGYNYPPTWLGTVAGLQYVAGSQAEFRLLISLLLIATDIGVCLLLARRGYLLAGCVYFLSPIAIAISGQHQQVESIALFLALGAALLLSGRSNSPLKGSDVFASVLLGLSLAFKPVFLLLPVWLLLTQKSWSRRFALLFIPLGVFGMSVLTATLMYPPDQVIQKIFFHKGTDNSPLINAFVPSQLAPWIIDHGGAKLAFLILLIAATWFFRKLDVFELALAYTVSAIVLSWAVANQYLLTPTPAISIYLNIGFLVWLILVVVYLGGAHDILNVWGLRSIQPHVMLDWTKVFQDLFPWILIGWILMIVAVRSRTDSVQPAFHNPACQDHLIGNVRDDSSPQSTESLRGSRTSRYGRLS